MPDCAFTMKPSAISPIPKKDGQASFTMDPPNRVCTIACSSSGDIEVIQCGSDGSVTVKATADNARGTLFVTKTCKGAVPEEGIVACGPTTVAVPIGAVPPPWTLKQKLTVVYAVVCMVFGIGGLVAGAVLGGVPGVLIGWFGGCFIGIVIGWVIEKILDP